MHCPQSSAQLSASAFAVGRANALEILRASKQCCYDQRIGAGGLPAPVKGRPCCSKAFLQYYSLGWQRLAALAKPGQLPSMRRISSTANRWTPQRRFVANPAMLAMNLALASTAHRSPTAWRNQLRNFVRASAIQPLTSAPSAAPKVQRPSAGWAQHVRATPATGVVARL